MIQNIYGWATHQPILLACAMKTSGDILDFGCGYYSTPLLHALFPDRYILSMDYNQEWLDHFKYMKSKNHGFRLAPSADVVIYCSSWGLAFIDHGMLKIRQDHIIRLKNRADIIIVHDTNRSQYEYDFSSFKYKFRYARWKRVAQTTALSMTIDLDFLRPLL